jgi:thiol-disulfide isomerase/thioredoxin
MVAKRSTKMGKLMPYVDVRSPQDVPMFESMIKTGPVFVLVYADWCGHCQRFKDKMWNDVANAENKAVNTAAVHYNMVDKTSMKNTPIEGYPTLFEVKPSSKKNVTTPVPTPQTKEELEKMVGVNTNVNEPTTPVTTNRNTNMNVGEPTPLNNNNINETMTENNLRSERVMKNSRTATTNTLSPNYVPENVENLPPEPEEVEEEKIEASVSQKGGLHRGGSLMESLLKVSADAAHAVVLAGSAIEISRRMKKRKATRRHRSGKKKQTRRR